VRGVQNNNSENELLADYFQSNGGRGDDFRRRNVCSVIHLLLSLRSDQGRDSSTEQPTAARFPLALRQAVSSGWAIVVFCDLVTLHTTRRRARLLS
jgi:hypothetical protein